MLETGSSRTAPAKPPPSASSRLARPGRRPTSATPGSSAGTSKYTVAVWVGYPNKLVPMTTDFEGGPVFGGTFPALIWHDFMVSALQIEKDGAEQAALRRGQATAAPAGDRGPITARREPGQTSTEHARQAPTRAPSRPRSRAGRTAAPVALAPDTAPAARSRQPTGRGAVERQPAAPPATGGAPGERPRRRARARATRAAPLRQSADAAASARTAGASGGA